MAQHGHGSRIGVAKLLQLPLRQRGLRGFGAALALGSATCALALFAPSAALAACTSPNDTTCDVTGNESFGDFYNGNGTAGTVNIQSGGTFNNNAATYFYNGNFDIDLAAGAMGTVNVLSGGTYNNNYGFENGYDYTGNLNVSGIFNNNVGAIFYNSDNGDGTVTVQNGGVFNNNGELRNGGNGEGSATFTVESGGTLFNATTGLILQIDSSISNYGTFTNLGVVTGGEIINQVGGVFNNYAGTNIGGDPFTNVTNHGTFNISHGNPSIATTNIYGNFTQSSTGTLSIRADFANTTSDRLVVNGTAIVDGMVDVNLLNFGAPGPLTRTFAGIISSTNAIVDNGLTTNEDTAVINYELVKPNANNIDLQISVDFTGGIDGGLTPNQRSTAEGLNNAFGSGAMLAFMPTLFELASMPELARAMDQLAPSGTGANSASMMQSGSTFAEQLLSCRTIGEGDANAVIREGQCLWARGTVSHTTFDHGGLSYGATETAPFYSAGAQVNLGGPWRMGGGIGYETSHLRTNSGSTTETDRLHLGGVLKYNPGPLMLAATVTGAFGWSDSERNVMIDDFTASARGKYDTDFVSGRLTAAYLMPFQRFYLKPQVDVAYMYVSRDGYQESGDGDIALAVAGSNDGVWSVSPMLEIGTEVRFAGGGVARPFLRGGITWRDTDGFLTSASFIGAPDGGPFTVTSRIDDVTADLAAGVDLITPSETTLRLQYDGQFGDTIEQHVGSAKLSVRY